jgi:hypothetical protein
MAGSGSGSSAMGSCAVKPDRLQGYSNRNPTRQVQAIPGLKSVTAHRVSRPADGRFQAFRTGSLVSEHNFSHEGAHRVRTARGMASADEVESKKEGKMTEKLFVYKAAYADGYEEFRLLPVVKSPGGNCGYLQKERGA